MEYCSNCGSELPSDTAKFCTECGEQVMSKESQSTSYQPKSGTGWEETGSYSEHLKVETRNYWRFGIFPVISIILSILGMGIFMTFLAVGPTPGHIGDMRVFFFILPVLGLIGSVASLVYIYYIYLNFDDLQNLQRKYHQRGVHPQPIEPILPVIAMFVFAPVAFYLKYDQLYKHMKEQHGQSDMLPPNPINLIIVLASFFVIPVIMITIGFLGNITFAFILSVLVMVGITSYLIKMEKDWQLSLNHHIQFHQNTP